ncbi:recombinase family protein [Gulosibacter sediminis]|uniref:recombinase family protein n=1 Tax=Gulosibacter sediminis TaxID=1729695 RepID=UPI0024A8F1A1|nr:recombinase family protein [Gulosibacter sediminis]
MAVNPRPSGTIIGYARVSTREQSPDAQAAELRAAGAVRVFVDHGESSRIADRPQWAACLDYLRDGDTLVIRALDRIAGTEQMAIELIRELARRGVRLRSLTEPFLDVDTSTPMGEAIVGIMATLAQLRVATIRENTMRGLAHARSQGRVGGRPTVMTPERTAAAVKLRRAGQSHAQIAAAFGVSKSSVARALTRADVTGLTE